MNRLFVAICLVCCSLTAAFAQRPAAYDVANYGVKIEPDKRVLVVLAALEVAGTKDADGKLQKTLNAPLSASGMKFRERLLADTADLPSDTRAKITAFVTRYKQANPKLSDAEIVSAFISMAYALSQPPELNDPVVTGDLPGSLLDLLDFAPLVREFYRRSTIGSNLDEYTKTYRMAADSELRPSAREMVGELLDYLHTRPQLIFSEKVRVETKRAGSKTAIVGTEIREHDRHFYIVPEMLAPKGNVNFLNIRDDYYVVVPPETDLAGSEGRRAYLRFVIDPLVLANAKEISAIREWTKPVLEQVRKDHPAVSSDPFLAMSRSLVAAVDIRQREFNKTRIATEQARQKLDEIQRAAEADAKAQHRAIDQSKADADKRQVTEKLAAAKQGFADEAALELYEEYERGSVLSFYFAEQLKGVEDSGFDIASSLKEMVASFDPAKENGRVAATADTRKRALAARDARRSDPGTVTISVENPVTARLIDIQKTIDDRDLAKAQADLKALLAQYPNEPRIHYNLGRVAGLQAAALNDTEDQAVKLVEAKVAYTNVINTKTPATDPALLSLTYVALGRIYAFFGQNDVAIKVYDEAIKVGDVRGGAFSEAIAAKQKLLKP